MTTAPIQALLLLVAYLGISLLVDHGGTLGADTGPKLATLKVMVERGALDPDVGYWAKQWDPTGSMHPMYATTNIKGSWIAVSTLPMLVAAYPLYEMGGVRIALLIPMLGGVAVALAARRLVAMLGGRGSVAFWLVGLASPTAIYAQDFWEHTVGLALMAWAVVLLTEMVAQRVSSLRRYAVAGLLLGTAASMRTEALVYSAVFVVVSFAFTWRKRPQSLLLASHSLVVVGIAVMTALNLLLEHALIGGNIRVNRASDTAAGALGDVGLRFREASMTLFGLTSDGSISILIMGAVLLVSLITLARCSSKWTLERTRIFSAVPVILYLVTFGQGPGFISGLATTTPLAAAAKPSPTMTPKTFLFVSSLLAMPLIWFTQYTGGAGPQWGGRYILLSGFVLLCLGVAALDEMSRWAGGLFIGLSLVVTVFGLSWVVQRTHGFDELRSKILSDPEAALIFKEPFLYREFATDYTDTRKVLSPPTAAKRQDAADVMGKAGAQSFTYVDEPSDALPMFVGWVRAQPQTATGLIDLRTTQFTREAAVDVSR